MYHRSAAMELLARLKTIRHNYNADQLHQLFNSLNLKSFGKANCEDAVLRNENKLYKNERFLIANLSQEQVHFFVKDSKGALISQKKPRTRGIFYYPGNSIWSGRNR